MKQIKSIKQLIEELIGGYWEDYDFINRQHLLAILRDEEKFNEKCWNGFPMGIMISEFPECIEKQVSKKLKVTNTKTGKVWIQENQQHSWDELAIEIVKSLERSGLVYCDIECLVQSNDGTWYILDECSHWEYIPEWYKVEKV